jgi:transposase-like protein
MEERGVNVDHSTINRWVIKKKQMRLEEEEKGLSATEQFYENCSECPAACGGDE